MVTIQHYVLTNRRRYHEQTVALSYGPFTGRDILLRRTAGGPEWETTFDARWAEVLRWLKERGVKSVYKRPASRAFIVDDQTAFEFRMRWT